MLELNFTSFPENNGLFVCPNVITVRVLRVHFTDSDMFAPVKAV